MAWDHIQITLAGYILLTEEPIKKWGGKTLIHLTRPF